MWVVCEMWSGIPRTHASPIHLTIHKTPHYSPISRSTSFTPPSKEVLRRDGVVGERMQWGLAAHYSNSQQRLTCVVSLPARHHTQIQRLDLDTIRLKYTRSSRRLDLVSTRPISRSGVRLIPWCEVEVDSGDCHCSFGCQILEEIAVPGD